MKLKRLGIITAVGFGAMLLSNVLLTLGAPRLLARLLVLGGAALFFRGMVAVIVRGERHPPWACPNCGKGIRNARRARTPRGGVPLRDGETFLCPHCGAMLHSWDLKKVE